jgi:hypothetical protein
VTDFMASSHGWPLSVTPLITTVECAFPRRKETSYRVRFRVRFGSGRDSRGKRRDAREKAEYPNDQ